MGEDGGRNSNRTVLYAVVGIVGAASAVIGKRYPNVDVSFRLAMPMYGFGWIIHSFRESLRSRWLWLTIIPLFVAHWLLITVFLPTIRHLNIWLWALLVILELVVVVVIVASASPEARAWRSGHKQDVVR